MQVVGINEGDSMWWLSYLRYSNSLKLQNSTQLILILNSNAEFSKLPKILLYSQTFGSHCPRWKCFPQKPCCRPGFEQCNEKNETTSNREWKFWYYQCFLLGLSSGKFSLWYFPPVSNRLNPLGICRGYSFKHFDFYPKCLIAFHNPMHV